MTSVFLHGEKVDLVPIQLMHIEGLYEAGKYPEIWNYTQGIIMTIEDARAYVQKALEQLNAIPFVIIYK